MTAGGWAIFVALVVFVGGPMVVAYHRGHVEIQRRHAESRCESFALDVEVVPFDPDLAAAGIIEPRFDYGHGLDDTFATMSTDDLDELRRRLVDQAEALYPVAATPGHLGVLRGLADDIGAVDDELRRRERYFTHQAPTVPTLTWVRPR